MINYHLTYDMKILFVGINPHYGSDRRGTPFSNNKMFWYLLHDAGLLEEDRTILRNDEKLREIYEKKFSHQYHLGLINMIDRPTRTISGLNRGEEILGRKRLSAAIKRYHPYVVCFVGKKPYQLFSGTLKCTYGWQSDYALAKVYVMHTPLHGLARVRIEELNEINRIANNIAVSRRKIIKFKGKQKSKSEIFTIGHSTRTLDEFVALLKHNKIQQLIDIRKIPGSSYNPQFNKETLSVFLRNRKIGYRHMVGLSGFRHTTKKSVNMGLYNASFRGFADYMQTQEFAENIKKLLEFAKKKRIALMCAEALPFRCHRSLVADVLVSRGIVVKHIYGPNSIKVHAMSPFAKIKDHIVYYPKK